MTYASFLLLFLFAAGPATELQDSDPVSIENRAKSLENRFISPCCWQQPVSMHYSPASDQMRADIRGMINQGLSDEEIEAKFVAQYGRRILAAPTAEGFSGLSYLLPLLILIAGAGLVAGYYRQHRATPAPAHPPKVKIDPRMAKRLEEELRG